MTEKDKRAMMGVSRRSFLAAAGIGALGVAGAGMFGCAPKGASEESALAADEKTPVAADETLDVQVCVLGAGPAGVTAAIEAAEKGAEVLVVDLNGAVTGNAHSVCACSTDYQHALGNDETPEEFVDYLLHYEDNPIVDKDLTLLVARESSKSIEWLSAHGVEFSGVATSDPEPFELPRIFVTKYGRDSQKAFVEPLWAAAQAAGVEFKFETEATALIQDASGAVVGVEAVGADGHGVTINAQSVILATGGFGGDDELMRRYAPWVPNCGALVAPGLWTRGNGFAIRAGQKVGAELLSGGGNLMYKNLEGANADHAGMALHVGVNGRRFCDESMGRLDRAVKAADLGLSDIFIIYDSELPNTLYTGTSSSGGTATTSGTGAITDALQAAIDAGTVFKADAIEALSRQMGIKATTLADTIETYNGWCRSGVDEEFGKPKEKVGLVLDPNRVDPNGTEQIEKTFSLLNEIKTPPFYATKCFISSYQLPATFGG
ncbi:MAG: FAD-dependent oxidoreductase, partial [Raoultibacter sp.]